MPGAVRKPHLPGLGGQCGSETAPTGPGWTVRFGNRTYRAWVDSAVRKPHLPGLGGQCGSETAPTGPGWTVRFMRYKLLEMVLCLYPSLAAYRHAKSGNCLYLFHRFFTDKVG